MMNRVEIITKTYRQLQQEMIKIIENADGSGLFINNDWSSELGSGTTSVIRNGFVIEKGAINFSSVRGSFTPGMENLLGEKATNYAATGISSIFHPKNPWVPVIHMNVRYFQLDNGTAWFGGGIDLTPHIVIPDDAVWFHQTLQKICNNYNSEFYPRFKEWADEYFFIPHRQETRGIGGIFFDRLKPDSTVSFEELFRFTQELAMQYPVIYSKFMEKYGNKKYTDREKSWQALRRGRYVEFNLIYDRGTKFGLESGGKTESILVSLPATAGWEYNYSPSPGSFEQETIDWLRKGVNWLELQNKT